MFWLSLLVSIFFLCVERLFGIEWNFHPDAVTYINESDTVFIKIINDPLSLINNGHYFLTSVLGSDVFFVTILNIIVYSHTNKIIYDFFYDQKFIGINKLILILAIFMPYRLHLSTTILKDTLIIYFLVSAVCFPSKVIMALPLLSYRAASILYFPLLIKNKIVLFTLFVGFLFLLSLYQDEFVEHLVSINSINMRFREFDTVENYNDLGNWASLIRALLWPLWALTGVFFFESLSPFYLPLAIGSLINLYLFFIISRGNFLKSLVVPFFVMSFFGIVVSGFASYYRYILPILVVLPLYSALNYG